MTNQKLYHLKGSINKVKFVANCCVSNTLKKSAQKMAGVGLLYLAFHASSNHVSYSYGLFQIKKTKQDFSDCNSSQQADCLPGKGMGLSHVLACTFWLWALCQFLLPSRCAEPQELVGWWYFKFQKAITFSYIQTGLSKVKWINRFAFIRC